ncbi:hypothetical protein AgCh_022804 [Apium graveolens]
MPPLSPAPLSPDTVLGYPFGSPGSAPPAPHGLLDATTQASNIANYHITLGGLSETRNVRSDLLDRLTAPRIEGGVDPALLATILDLITSVMEQGSYKVRLHFAKILFSDDATSQGIGRRIFDVSIQGNVVRKDFNVAEEAGGIGKGFTLEQDVSVNGFGTRGLSSLAIAGIIFASLVSLGLILVVLWMKGFLGGKDTEDEDDTQDLIEGEEQFRRVKEWISSYHLGTVETYQWSRLNLLIMD